ncbi:hypothetical protein [Rhodoferax aquaticus]|nr:hypothetical protein [Rhodoferax aquaticus]
MSTLRQTPSPAGDKPPPVGRGCLAFAPTVWQRFVASARESFE